MNSVIKNANVFFDDRFLISDILIVDGIIADIGLDITYDSGSIVYDMNNCFVFPGFIDVHVHLREPGFSYKETILTGSLAAAHGGYTTICAMPNLDPVPDCLKNINKQIEIINRDAKIRVFPYASITEGQNQKKLSEMDSLAKYAIAFSDDGVGVQDTNMMQLAMKKVKSLNKIIAAHCEVNDLLKGGYIHDGKYAEQNGHLGICSESEWREVERDIDLVRKTRCDYHVCHISTKESVELIRNAKAEGLPVTCETAPHYLVLCDMDMYDDGRFKMNPPLRSSDDKKALIEGIKDGTIDMIATDHAPHSDEEKSGGLRKSLNGIVGLETAFPILYTNLVKKDIITLEKLITLMQVNPSKRFGLGNSIKIGQPADLTVFDLNAEYKIDSKSFLSKGRSTPFEGVNVFGRCRLTMVGGVAIWEDIN